ncbi:hypothetical protein [Oceanobacillus kapialis]|uniref:Uncharacterized protein n=1 Tax=Oceanobacillus kapialis TaxID=481353 RepID=A0ABW5PVM0_9BACI
MQKIRKHNVIKALGVTFIITIIAFFSIDMSLLNKALYLSFVAVVSFASLLAVSTLTSKAYEKFLKQMD